MSSRRPWVYAVAGAVAATAATVAVVAVVAQDDGGDGDAGTPAATATPEPTAEPTGEPAPSAEPTGTGRPTSPAPAGEDARVALPVYYVGDTPAGPRLFREFHVLPGDPDDPGVVVRSALTDAVSGDALDPDYGSPWPAGTSVAGVTVTADLVEVDLTGADLRRRPADVSRAQAGIAVEQVVHTAQAVLQDRLPVQLLLDGGRSDRVLGVPAAEPLAEGDPMDVQAPVWVIDPQDRDAVGRTFTVEGRGAFFEANVSWQLLARGRVVEDGFATARECCTLSPYSFEVTADPGRYVLRVYSADESGGEGYEFEDTKRLTVR